MDVKDKIKENVVNSSEHITTTSSLAVITNANDDKIKDQSNILATEKVDGNASELVSLPTLNTRFRDYLSKVKAVNQLNNSLSEELAKNYDKCMTKLNESSNKLHKELHLQRQMYTCNYGQYLIYNTKYKRYSEKCQQFYNKIERLKVELNSIKESKHQLSEVDKLNKEELQTLTNKINEAQKQNSILKEEISRLEEEEDQLDNKLRSEEVDRIQCQLDTEFLKTEILFTRMIFDEIINVFKRTPQSAIKDAQFYGKELDEAKQEIRTEFQKKIQRSLQSLSNEYASQFEQIKSSFIIDNNEEDKKRRNSVESKTKINTVRNELTQLQETVSEVKAQNSKLSNHLSSLEASLEQMILGNREKKEQHDSLMSSTRSKIMELIVKIQNAKSGKDSLQTEIDTYRQILCDEEERMDMLNKANKVESKLTSSTHPDRKITTSNMITRSHSHYLQVVTEGIISKSSNIENIITKEVKDIDHIKDKDANSEHWLQEESKSNEVVTEYTEKGDDDGDGDDEATNIKANLASSQTARTNLKSAKFDNTTMSILCRCGKNEMISSDTLMMNHGGVYVRCVDCGEWSHARCYNVGDLKDRKRKNFYCSNCYKAMKRRRY